jgi:predicted Ser/Thr protein kinase
MLTAADVIAGKLLVQLGDASVDDVRAAMREVAADREAVFDLVARLYSGQKLAHEQVSRIRRYVALYETVRAEAVYLHLLEKKHGVPKAEAHELLARIEADTYRSRLGATLVEAGRLTAEQDRALVQRARAAMAAEDEKVVARYLKEDCEGVARPLIQHEKVAASAFKVSTIFRSRETARIVKAAVQRLRGMAEAAVPATASDPDFVPEQAAAQPPSVAAMPESDGADMERLARADTARFRNADAAPKEGDDLRARTAIGRYQVVECLGQGGMGAVYLASDPESAGALVAVKVVLTAKAKPEDMARFKRESEVMQLIDNPHVVHLIEEGKTDDGLDYMVIQAFPGKMLRKVLRDKKTLPLDVTLAMLERLLEGLAATHKAGVVHRDLKPENVFVIAGADREVKLIDFGIARRMDDDLPPERRLYRTRAGVISGSPAYVAPETITDDALDGRTDIYSLGVMLFEMLTGKLPLIADSPYEYLREHLLGVPLTLGQGKKDARWHPDLERLIARMMAKEKPQRPASCDEILAELRGGLRDQALAYLSSPPEPVTVQKGTVMNKFFNLISRASWT